MTTQRHIICNKIQTPDGSFLESFSVHDYQEHTDIITGEVYLVDGGHNYLRRNINVVPAKELTVYSDAPHEVIRESMKWGSYGITGKEDFHWIALQDMADSHINAILNREVGSPNYRQQFKNELEYRKLYDIEVLD